MLSGKHLVTLYRQNLLPLTPAGNRPSQRDLGGCLSVANQCWKSYRKHLPQVLSVPGRVVIFLVQQQISY